ncbi:MAG: hypothetical protein ACI9TA_001483 [Reinekea sp.]|jgi:hypothetical protein
MRGLLRITSSCGQEMAQNRGEPFGCFGEHGVLCNGYPAAVSKISQRSVICLRSYPSPDRCDPFGIVPVTPFLRTAEYCFNLTDYVALNARSVNHTLSSHKTGGIFSCLKHLTSSQRLHSLASRLVLITMQNVRLLALALAALLAKLSATTTASKAHLLAALSAHLPTTSKVTRLIYSMKINETAAAGHPCARRFCF